MGARAVRDSTDAADGVIDVEDDAAVVREGGVPSVTLVAVDAGR